MDITNAIGKRIATKLGDVVIRKFLGKGKSGYSYMAESNDGKYVIKFMHYEPCAYYSFGDANKVELEVEAFKKLASLGIKVPRLIEANAEHNYLLKEYIEGDLVTELVKDVLYINQSADSGLPIKQPFEELV